MDGMLESLLPQLQQSLAPQIAARLGVDESLVQQGMAFAVPLLISALARNSAAPAGAQALTGALARDHDGTALHDPSASMDRYASGEGSAILGHIFGAQRPGIEQAITSSTGVDGSTLLQMLAPAVMGALGQTQRQQGLDANGVASLLQGEQGDALQMANKLLDANGDGSALDDVMGLVGKLFGQR